MSELEHLTDEELMTAYQQGNAQAFALLYSRYSGKVYGYLRTRTRDPGLVDDLFQATFLKLHQARGRYDSTFPFAPWLFTVCRNAMIDGIRKKKRTLEEADPDAVDQAAASEWAPMSLPDLSVLTESQRSAVELRYGGDLSFDEIAARLGTSTSNARQLLSRAMRKLKAWAGKEE